MIMTLALTTIEARRLLSCELMRCRLVWHEVLLLMLPWCWWVLNWQDANDDRQQQEERQRQLVAQDETIDVEVALLQEREQQIRQLEVRMMPTFLSFVLLVYILVLHHKWKCCVVFTLTDCLSRTLQWLTARAAAGTRVPDGYPTGTRRVPG